MIPNVLGKEVRDRVTGFSGIATARAELLLGTPRVLIEQRSDGDQRWFDEPRVEIDPIQTRPPIAMAT